MGMGMPDSLRLRKEGGPKHLSRSEQGAMVLQGDTYLRLAILEE